MQRHLLNECLISMRIATEGPLLIQTGLASLSEARLAPVRTQRLGSTDPRGEVFIPGSSLKGVLRSHAERIARALCYDNGVGRIGSCDPFEREPNLYMSCNVKFRQRKRWREEQIRNGVPEDQREEEIDGRVAYRDSCPICRLFGSLSCASRLFVEDAYLVQHGTTVRRDGVGIDRFTGGSYRGALFDMEVTVNSTFQTQLRLINFELWQLGILGYVLRDLEEGLLPIGGGSSRGLGKVAAQIEWVRVRYIGSTQNVTDGLLRGIGTLWEGTNYRFAPTEHEQIPIPSGVIPQPDGLGLRTVYAFEIPEAIDALWRGVAPKWNTYIGTIYSIPETMVHTRFGRLDLEGEIRE